MLERIEKLEEQMKNARRALRLDTTDVIVKVKLKDKTVKLPEYKTEGSAAADIYAHLNNYINILPNSEPTIISTGLFVEIPEGYRISIRPRSGLSLKGIILSNTPGTIDSDYRGEIGIIVQNTTNHVIAIHPYDRIAQMTIEKVNTIKWKVVQELTETKRGSGGYGSTGK